MLIFFPEKLRSRTSSSELTYLIGKCFCLYYTSIQSIIIRFSFCSYVKIVTTLLALFALEIICIAAVLYSFSLRRSYISLDDSTIFFVSFSNRTKNIAMILLSTSSKDLFFSSCYNIIYEICLLI